MSSDRLEAGDREGDVKRVADFLKDSSFILRYVKDEAENSGMYLEVLGLAYEVDGSVRLFSVNDGFA